MNISVKLKYTELQSLEAELERVLQVDDCHTRSEVIVGLLMLKFYRKIKRTCALIEPRMYRMSIEPEMAVAFVIYFSQKEINHVSHAGNIIQRMISLFDQQTINYQLC